MKLNKKLTKLRESKRLTRKEAAHRLGISQDLYTNWEMGKSQPKPNHLIDLSEMYGITLNELLGVKVWKCAKKTPPTEWGYYLVRKKGSRISHIAIHDTNQFFDNPDQIDEWTIIPK